MLADSEILRVGISLERTGTDSAVGVGTGDVQTRAHIEAQSLKAMDLVIHRHSSDETGRPCIADIVIKDGQRARTHKGIRAEGISPAVAVVPVTVGGRIVYRAVSITPVRLCSRVEEGCLGDRASVGIIGI